MRGTGGMGFFFNQITILIVLSIGVKNIYMYIINMISCLLDARSKYMRENIDILAESTVSAAGIKELFRKFQSFHFAGNKGTVEGDFPSCFLISIKFS